MEFINQFSTWFSEHKYLLFISIISLISSWLIFRFYLTRWKRHKNYPVVFAISTVFAAFVSITTLWESIIAYAMEKLGIHVAVEHDKYSLIAFFIFCLTIGIFILIFYGRMPLNDFITGKSDQGSHKRIRQKKTAPPQIPSESPIFFERVKRLLEIKYHKLKLEYLSEHSILYGSYKEGLNHVSYLIFCDPTLADKNVKGIEVKRQLNKLKSDLSKELGFNRKNEIINYYYIIENGNFLKENDEIICYNEKGFENSIIDFKDYLQTVVHKFETDPLPFLTTNTDNTLANTFIPTKFNNGKENLERKLNAWQKAKSNKQIVILGAYGTGKTSFLKYYNYLLAKEILSGKTKTRIPVFISLTNTSPMHGGITERCKSFVSESLGVNYKLFEHLVFKGRILFLLDGFDEMGFIGTKEQRFKQLDSIWQLATKDNKIILTGRPSYFPNEFDLNTNLNVKSQGEELIPQVFPYSEKITLDFLTKSQILKSIENTYPNRPEYKKYVTHNISILDLCKRPSLLHIVKEMLPKLVESGGTKISSSSLMKLYVDHWIDRQIQKNITGVLEAKSERKKFIFDFYSRIAGNYYDSNSGNIFIEPETIKKEIKNEIDNQSSLSLENDEEFEGLFSEILTGYFLERIGNTYKFVHKSFFEFFVSNEIIELIKLKDYNNPLIKTKEWSLEVIDFVYEFFEFKETREESNPLLLQIVKENYRFNKLKNWVFRTMCQILLLLKSNLIFIFGFFLIAFVYYFLDFHKYPDSLEAILLAIFSSFVINLHISEPGKVELSEIKNFYKDLNKGGVLGSIIGIAFVASLICGTFHSILLSKSILHSFFVNLTFFTIFIFSFGFSFFASSRIYHYISKIPFIQFLIKSHYIETNKNQDYFKRNGLVFMALIKVFSIKRFNFKYVDLSLKKCPLNLYQSSLFKSKIKGKYFDKNIL